VVGGVETRAFEHDPYRLKDLLQGLLAALGALGQGRIAKFLLLVELYTTIGATIRVNGHTTPQLIGLLVYYRHTIIVLPSLQSKGERKIHIERL
jgi:hypothetical protein